MIDYPPEPKDPAERQRMFDALFAKLSRIRSCTCVNVCLYNREGDVDFLEAAGVYGGIVEEGVDAETLCGDPSRAGADLEALGHRLGAELRA